MIIPSYQEIPLDDDDYRYSQSFSVEECNSPAAKAFWDAFGFLIVRAVVSAQECQELEDDMAVCLKEHGKGLSNFGVPKGVNALFRPSLLRLRQNPAVCRAFASVLQTNNFVVNHDRWLWHKAPMDPNKPLSKRNLHLDLNPWDFFGKQSNVQARLDRLDYGRNDRAFISENNDVHSSMQPCIQALINLSDLKDSKDGGTIIVPGSHQTFATWFQEAADETQKTVGPMQYKFDDNHAIQSLAQHPKLRPGSMLIWDQRVVHGSTPNRSAQDRKAIPLRAFSRDLLSKKCAKERGKAIAHQLDQCGFADQVTELGRRVFGLDLV